MAEEMRDGIRKVLLKRESKRAGKDVFAYKVPYRDANGKQTSATFGTLKEAQAFRNKIRRQRDEGLVLDAKAGMVSFGEYAATWLERARVKRDSTYANYERHLRLYILPALGGRQLRAVIRTDIQAFVTKIHTGGLAPRTVASVYVTVSAVFRAAHLLDKKITASPCVEITLPEIPDKEVEVLTVAQVRALAAGIPDRYRAAVLLAAGCGLRVSEVLGLTWDRIDLGARTVKVDRQITPRGTFGLPKTKRSKRVVPMPDMVADALIKHRADFPPARQDIVHTDGSTVEGAELVFTRANGKAGNHRDMSRAFQIARARAGLPDAVTFHTLRHTYASLQIAAGTSLTALQRRMGHGSIQVTSDIYGHLLPTEDDRTRTAIDDAFSGDDPDDGRRGRTGTRLTCTNAAR
ncbi:tyrosine-type recombinase/integrase [Actinoallomurus sp. NPDC050550]|uniref:tyrosine-type recombinase/integrase n=1 Tax=Actinoallomurus sp. NPDC050550 TaxID=3154937 RepID=UPI0033F0E9A7